MIKTYRVPEGAPQSHDFEIMINNTPVELHECRVSAYPYNRVWPGQQRPIEQTELASFVYFDIDEPAELSITATKNFEDAIVRPLSKGIRPCVDGRNIRFTIDKPGQFTLELDGIHNALHIFVNPIEDFGIDKDDLNVIYFGPGVHEPGLIQLQSGQTVYLDGEAVVHGFVHAEDVENIRVLGRGIFDDSTQPREGGQGTHFTRCKNVEISGVVYRDPRAWTVSVFNCDGLRIDNVKLVGLWRYNADGIDICNSTNIKIENSFVRAFDDCIVIKGLKPYDRQIVENVEVVNCVTWCDWGRALELGAETCADEFKNIRFYDCDIIHGSTIAMDLQGGDRADIHDVLFEDIRVEYIRNALPEIYHHVEDEPYTPDMSVPYLPKLFVSVHYHCMWSKDDILGRHHNVRFKNISVYLPEELPMPKSSFSGVNEENTTYDVTIENLTVNGKKITSLEEANVEVGRFARNIRII